jgi:hypothetical protein
MESIAEIWKDVQGYEGLYQVSNFGRVKSLGRFVDRLASGHCWKKERILKLHKKHNGYLGVSLLKDGKIKNFNIHRLVAIAFIPNPDNLPQIDHINADKTNNNVNNLRWVTAKENMNNPLTKVRFIGKNHPFYGKKHTDAAKLKIRKNHADFSGALNPKARKIRNIETNEIFYTIKSAGQKYGVESSSIRDAIRRNGKSAGYHWEYL